VINHYWTGIDLRRAAAIPSADGGTWHHWRWGLLQQEF